MSDVNMQEMVQRAQASIPDYNNKISFLTDFSRRIMDDIDGVSANPNEGRRYLQFYKEITQFIPPSTDDKLRFLVFGSDAQPELIYTREGIISAEFYCKQFDMLVSELPDEQAFNFVIASVNDNLSGKAMVEWAEYVQANPNDATRPMSEFNWSKIANHIEDVAKRMGWDGRFNDELAPGEVPRRIQPQTPPPQPIRQNAQPVPTPQPIPQSNLQSTQPSTNSGQPQRRGINLKKGQRVSLDGSMSLALVGLGWDVNHYTGGSDFDLDASAFLLGANGKLGRNEDFIFYNNLKSRNGAVVHQGDNLTGAGDGDDEVIIIDFTKIPADIERISICVTIHDAAARRQNFGQVSNAYLRIAKLANQFDTTGEQILRFDLAEEYSIETALVVAEIYKKNGEWKFNAVGAGYQGGLEAIIRSYGGNV